MGNYIIFSLLLFVSLFIYLNTLYIIILFGWGLWGVDFLFLPFCDAGF